MSASHTFVSAAEIERLCREYETIRRNIEYPPSFEEWVEICLKSRKTERVGSAKPHPAYAEQRNRYKT